MYDVVIIGAGPAGATLARLLPSSYRVLLVDKRNLDQQSDFTKEKACGGLISPDAQKMLASFDLGVPKHVLQDPQMFFVNVIDQDNHLEAKYQRNYLNIDREQFDRWYYNLVPSSVEKMNHTIVKKISYEEHLYHLQISNNGEIATIQTKYLVGADGANSIVRSTFYASSKIKKYTSIQRWYLQDQPINHYIAIFDKTITDYYAWTISKDQYLILGSAFLDKQPNQAFEKLEDLMKHKGYDLSRPVKQEGAFILRPSCLCHIELGKQGHFLIGEAAGYISPSSAEGYSYAFRSAKYLADAFIKNKKIHQSYRRKCRRIHFNLIYKWLKYPFMYHPRLRKWIIRSGLMRLK
jgi:flavin-dependent dehydrogenase